jgi:hypothetical protein
MKALNKRWQRVTFVIEGEMHEQLESDVYF